jgi:hypothetical protein
MKYLNPFRIIVSGDTIMASKNKETSQDTKKGYEPKATARHAKKNRTKQDDIDTLKKKIDTDKYLAKKYESNRKTEIKALPKEDRPAAKAELKESKEKRKEAEKKDREKLQAMIYEERTEKGRIEKESFDEEIWLKGGRKKGKEKETPAAKPAEEPKPTESAAQTQPEVAEESEEVDTTPPQPETLAEEPKAESEKAPEKQK